MLRPHLLLALLLFAVVPGLQAQQASDVVPWPKFVRYYEVGSRDVATQGQDTFQLPDTARPIAELAHQGMKRLQAREMVSVRVSPRDPGMTAGTGAATCGSIGPCRWKMVRTSCFWPGVYPSLEHMRFLATCVE